jgi:hypothetical protein
MRNKKMKWMIGLVTVFLLLTMSMTVALFDGEVVCSYGEAECSDGIDNDERGDGIDFAGACQVDEIVFSCPQNLVTSEMCKDYCLEKYGAGTYVKGDPQCRSPLDVDESTDPQCSNGIDDDGDGLVDYPYDTDCISPRGVEKEARYLAPGNEKSLWSKFLNLFN